MSKCNGLVAYKRRQQASQFANLYSQASQLKNIELTSWLICLRLGFT